MNYSYMHALDSHTCTCTTRTAVTKFDNQQVICKANFKA